MKKNAAEVMAGMLGSSAKACPLAHPCRVCGVVDPRTVSTVHLNGKHTLSACEKCGPVIDRLIRAGSLSLADARDNAKAHAAVVKSSAMTVEDAIAFALGPCPHGEVVRKDCRVCMRVLPQWLRLAVKRAGQGLDPHKKPEPLPRYAPRPWK